MKMRQQPMSGEKIILLDGLSAMSKEFAPRNFCKTFFNSGYLKVAPITEKIITTLEEPTEKNLIALIRALKKLSNRELLSLNYALKSKELIPIPAKTDMSTIEAEHSCAHPIEEIPLFTLLRRIYFKEYGYITTDKSPILDYLDLNNKLEVALKFREGLPLTPFPKESSEDYEPRFYSGYFQD